MMSGTISGFHMKSIACKWRKNVAVRRSSRALAGEEPNLSSIPAGYTQISTTMPYGEQESLEPEAMHESGTMQKEDVPPGQLRMIALQSICLHPFSVLLLTFPLGVVALVYGWGPSITFWLNIFAMIPLAKILGDATEELADAIENDTLSGLLNATLGNAVEMILCVQTLRKGLLNVVKATLLGSILSNNLLVLGTSFFLGGLSPSRFLVGRHHIIHTDGDNAKDLHNRRYSGMTADEKALENPARCITLEKEQFFTVKGALVNMSMQLLSMMTIALPTVLGTFGHESQTEKELLVSRFGACVIASSYIAYLVFHLVTHKGMLAKDERNAQVGGEDDGGVEPKLGAAASILLMTVVTIMIAVSSEVLVDSMDEVISKAHLPPEFIGVVLLPFAGNACEHASALRFAMIDRPGLAIGIAVGSSTQISLFVIPFAVLFGWCIDQPMDLNFGIQNLAVLFLSTITVLSLVLDGRANWLKGFLLMNAYAFTGLLYWFS